MTIDEIKFAKQYHVISFKNLLKNLETYDDQ